MHVTQPWQDELVDLAQKEETKLAKFKQTQTTVGKMLAEQVTRDSLEQAKGSVTKMTIAHDKLQDVYTRWFDKTNAIIEEHKEQK
jgi:hypothetical protein